MAYDSSVANRLVAVRDAINTCLLAQRYGIVSRSKEMPALSVLRTMERELEAELAREGGTEPILSVVQIDRPS